MSSISITNVNTKLEAYKLIHDPTRLFSLLYSKYGDIEEDYFISYTNQLLFNIPSKFNRKYKESLYINNIQEFLHRYYRKREIKDRIPKLSDYYKNYVLFFCRPFLKQINMRKIVYNYQDKQAEIFYKNNYSQSLDYEKEKVNKEKDNSNKKSFDELSSLDNITNNKIIFDDRTKKIIDNELCTLTLETSIINKNNLNNNNNDNDLYKGELISKRSNANNSFEKVVHYLINSGFKKKIENKKKKKVVVSKKMLMNSPSAHQPYIAKIFKINYSNINSLNKEIIPKNKKIKNSLYTLSKNNFIRTGGFFHYNYNKVLLSPNFTKNDININTNNIKITKYEHFKNLKPNNYTNSFQNFHKKNKTNYSNNIINSNNVKKIVKFNNSNRFNINTIYKNFSNLSETLNKYKQLSYKSSNKTTFTNKNISNLSKSKRAFYGNSSNVLTKSNNNIIKNKNIQKKETTRINKMENLILKQNNFNIQKNSNSNLKMNMYKVSIHHTKNKTFDFNSLYPEEQINKFNTNNNFNNLRIFYQNKGHIKKKINSKFNLIKKPITEVITRIVSPSHKKSENKISRDKSLSNKKDRTKTKKIFFGLNQTNKNNNIKTNKYVTQKMFPVSRKNNMTFSTEGNCKNENINLEMNFKNKKKINTANRKSLKNEENKYVKKKEIIHDLKIKASCASPLSNYTSNYNKLIKNKIYGNFNNTMKNDNYSFNKKKSKNSKNKLNKNKINDEKDNNTNNLFNDTNKINNEILEMMADNQIYSRNKKQNTSKISATKSQHEINLRDICIKTVKNKKPQSIGSKKSLNLNNNTFLNKNKKNNIKYNLIQINSSSELHNSPKKNILTNLKMKKISLKKEVKKFSQGINSKNTKKNSYRMQMGNNNNKINVIFNGDVIINKNQLIEIKQNNLTNNRNSNNDINKNKNGMLIINNINKDRGNSFKIINVNRNINLIK